MNATTKIIRTSPPPVSVPDSPMGLIGELDGLPSSSEGLMGEIVMTLSDVLVSLSRPGYWWSKQHNQFCNAVIRPLAAGDTVSITIGPSISSK